MIILITCRLAACIEAARLFSVRRKEKTMPSLTTYTLLKQEHNARRGEFKTVHGTVQTPAFQNVATAGAIKGGLSAQDLKDIGAQVMLCNTYHLHLRPGDKLVADMGGLHKFTRWNGPILTDSGGFQVFSLAKLRKITEEGVTFASHLDGHRIFMGPEESMQIQANLGSTIAMAFDECVENPAQHDYSKDSCERTTRWLKRCKAEMARLKHEGISVNPDQLLFGINQGCTYADLRVEHMKQIAELELDGYAIGGLAVGEPTEVMYEMISQVEPYMPKDKIRYLMGVGTPGNIIEAVARGVDLFDCVMPSRNARHGHLNTWSGIINIKNAKYERDERPIDPGSSSPQTLLYYSVLSVPSPGVCSAEYSSIRWLAEASSWLLACRRAASSVTFIFSGLSLRRQRRRLARSAFTRDFSSLSSSFLHLESASSTL